jgi:hypothetical protein
MTLITGPHQIQFARLLTLRAGLKLEAKGMKSSRGPSMLSILRQEGYVKARTAAKAVEELNELLAEFDTSRGDKT